MVTKIFFRDTFICLYLICVTTQCQATLFCMNFLIVNYSRDTILRPPIMHVSTDWAQRSWTKFRVFENTRRWVVHFLKLDNHTLILSQKWKNSVGKFLRYINLKNFIYHTPTSAPETCRQRSGIGQKHVILSLYYNYCSFVHFDALLCISNTIGML
jgi:hypothetical protein